MKSSFIVLAAGVMMASSVSFGQMPDPAPASAESTDGKWPALQLVSPRLDFGAHLPLKFVSDTMTFMNAGTVPITLERAQGECSCTDATILGDSKTFQPGEKIDVLVAVEFPREAGLYTKQVLVYEKGNPTPFPMPFDFEVGFPIVINGGPRYAIVNELGGKLTLQSRDHAPFKVISISGMAPIYEGFDPATDALSDHYMVYYKFDTLNTLEVPRWLVIETDHPEAEMMPIPARFKGYDTFIDKAAWHAMDEFIALNSISAKGPTRTSMLFTGKGVIPGKNLSVKSSNKNLGIQVVGVRKPDRGGGMQIDFDVVPKPDAHGFQWSIATIEYDGASTRFDVFCRIDPALPAPPVPNK